jgi:hypothetical protein
MAAAAWCHAEGESVLTHLEKRLWVQASLTPRVFKVLTPTPYALMSAIDRLVDGDRQ